MSYRTLSELESDVRDQFDLVGLTTRYPQALIFRLLNEGIRSVRKIATEAGSSAYLAMTTATLSAGATSGRHGTLAVLPGGVSLDMVRDVMAQSSNGEWYRLPEIPPQYECVDGTKDTDTGEPQGWILAEYDIETSTGAETSQSRRILITPPASATFNLRIRYLPTWTDAISTTKIMADSTNLAWVVWDVGCRLAERDEDMAALQRRVAARTSEESALRARCAGEGSKARSRIAAKRAQARRW